jgi:hypothetical protein
MGRFAPSVGRGDPIEADRAVTWLGDDPSAANDDRHARNVGSG